jgi:peptide deformylase
MAIKEICRLGHPLLRKNSQDIPEDELGSPSIKALTQDLIETMHENGGIGLAAPQIGINLNVVVVEIAPNNHRYPYSSDLPLTVLYNPLIEVMDPTIHGFWEGCLSIPDLRGFVERPQKIVVFYKDCENRDKDFMAEHFLATVLQHEIDHLRGRLFIDHIQDYTKFSYLAEYEMFHSYE